MRAFGRLLLELLVRLIYWPGKAAAIDRAKIERVLVIRPDPRVGNVLLTVPLIRALKNGLPKAKVDVLVARGFEPLLEGLPFIDALVDFDKRAFFRAPWRFWATVRRIRAAKYDVVIEAAHLHAFSFTASWLTHRTQAPARIGHDRGLARRFLTHAVAHDPAHVNEVAAKLELLGPLGIAPAGEQLETRLGREGPKVLRLLTEGLPKQRFAALNLGARKEDHRWPAEKFGELALRLRVRGLVPLLLWGPGEASLCEAAMAASSGCAVKGPPTDLEELAAAFRVSAVVVTADTGPMHLASAVGAKVVALFRADDAERWAHPGPNFAEVRVDREPDAVAAVDAAVGRLLQP